jgi:hypothetical protein
MQLVSTSILAIAIAVAVGGCAVRTQPVGYVEVSSAPVHVERYPRTYYDGHVVYLVNDRWMYNDGGRWAYYREEPSQLRRQRQYVQQAPPAYGAPGYSTPYRGGPSRGNYPPPAVPPVAVPPASAPPAVRVQ